MVFNKRVNITKLYSAGLIYDALTNTTAASDCQTPNGQILGDGHEQGTDGYGAKD